MVEPRVMAHVVERAERSPLGVRSAVHAAVDSGIHHEPRAHEAWLKRHVDGAAREAPTAQLARGGDHRGELGMGRRVGVGLSPVVRTRHHTLIAHHYGADGHLALGSGQLGLLEGHAHIGLIRPQVLLASAHLLSLASASSPHGVGY